MSKLKFRFGQRFIIPASVWTLMQWCRKYGFSIYVSFGKDKIPDVLIRKKKEAQP